MFYDKQPEQKRENYKNMLKIIGSLSRIFSESDVPYLYYRAHENVFSKYFELVNNSRSDDSADAYSTESKVGIGLKTWVGQDNQKVAEFGKLRPKYKDLSGIELVKKIAGFRNKRIRTTMKAHGLEKMLYHIVKRVPNAMCIYEAAFDYIDISNIQLLEKRGTENSVYFTDKKHIYHFSMSKNTLYMIFEDMEFLDKFEVMIHEDPYELLSSLFSIENKKENGLIETVTGSEVTEVLKENIPKKEQLCLRLYSSKSDGTKYVANKSGLNQWNGSRSQYKTDKDTGSRQKIGEKKRNANELYIPYPAEDRNRGDFFPARDVPFDLMLPDGQWISAKVCQDDGKAIMSNPNKVLGKWLLRDVFEVDEGTVITYDMLEEFGVDSVMFTKLSEGKYCVDFCDLGTYESFYGLNTSE